MATHAIRTVFVKFAERDRLRAGDAIEGPAAAEEAGTTTIIDSADSLQVEEQGCPSSMSPRRVDVVTIVMLS